MTAPRRTKEAVQRAADKAAERAFDRAATVKSERPLPDWMADPSLLPRKPPGWKAPDHG